MRLVAQRLQDRNRRDLAEIFEFDLASEAYASARWPRNVRAFSSWPRSSRPAAGLLDPARDWTVVPRDTLALAAAHQRYCLNIGREMDSIGRRGEIRNAADAILAAIRTEWSSLAKDGAIELNRTQLTHRFAGNPRRNNALTPARLYQEIVPDLEKRGLALSLPREGRLQTYLFDASETA